MNYLTRLLVAFIAPIEAYQASETPRTIQASFYSLAYAPGLESIQTSLTGSSHTTRLSTANFTPTIPLELVDNQALLFDPNKPGRIIANIPIPETIEHALIILIPSNPDAPLPYRGFALHFDLHSFPLGTYQLVNLSPHQIRGAIGHSYTEVSPGKICQLALDGEPGTIQGLKFEFLEKNQWTRLTESRCAVRRDRRWLLCAYRDPASEQLHLRSIPDREPPKSDAEAASMTPTKQLQTSNH